MARDRDRADEQEGGLGPAGGREGETSDDRMRGGDEIRGVARDEEEFEDEDLDEEEEEEDNEGAL